MKLLFDQNLSFKLCRLLDDIFPASQQLRLLGLDQSDDETVWDEAKNQGFVIATQDVDFVNLTLLRLHPPKVIWLRCGNQPTAVIERILRSNCAVIESFGNDATKGFVEIFK